MFCGRGGKENAHPGNKLEYSTATKQEKPLILLSIKILENIKPGSVLSIVAIYILLIDGSLIFDIVATQVPCANEVRICPGGKDRARKKALQALREGTAKLHKEGEIVLFVLGGVMPNLFTKGIGLASKRGIFYSTPYKRYH